MIPVGNEEVFKSALGLLMAYGERTSIRGRFVLVYLGLRKMRHSLVPLGNPNSTTASEIEEVLDRLYTKTNRAEPLTVLTSPFGQSTSPHAPWSTRTNDVAPGNQYGTNTWRNNLNVQKGIGCPAEPETIQTLLDNPLVRLNCPWMRVDEEGRQQCGVTGTIYRGDEHSIWLRMTSDGYQVVDLDKPAVYEPYLAPKGNRIPIFALIPVLYHSAPSGVYPDRQIVGVPEFCDDFGLRTDQAVEMFDCDPDSRDNSEIIIMASSGTGTPLLRPEPEATLEAKPLPAEPDPITLNTGVGAEIAVARELLAYNWAVSYTGNVRGVGYDLLATHGANTLHIEVKSSVSLCRPELTETEWKASQNYGDSFVLAIVDFYGSPGQQISYVRNPAANVIPITKQVNVFGVPRQDVATIGVGAEFL